MNSRGTSGQVLGQKFPVSITREASDQDDARMPSGSGVDGEDRRTEQHQNSRASKGTDRRIHVVGSAEPARYVKLLPIRQTGRLLRQRLGFPAWAEFLTNARRNVAEKIRERLPWTSKRSISIRRQRSGLFTRDSWFPDGNRPARSEFATGDVGPEGPRRSQVRCREHQPFHSA